MRKSAPFLLNKSVSLLFSSQKVRVPRTIDRRGVSRWNKDQLGRVHFYFWKQKGRSIWWAGLSIESTEVFRPPLRGLLDLDVVFYLRHNLALCVWLGYKRYLAVSHIIVPREDSQIEGSQRAQRDVSTPLEPSMVIEATTEINSRTIIC